MNVTDICIPKDLPVLKDFDNRLRCGICYEYMKTAMMTNCSHNYCSMCIRKSLMYKGSCPTCFAVASDSQLRNNKVVDELIIIFTRLSIEVQKLVQECRGNKPLQYTKDSRNDEESSSSVNRNVSRSGYRSANVETHNSELYFSPSKPSTSFFVSKIKEPKTLPSILKESGEGCSKSKGEEPSNQKTESMPTSNSELQIPSMFTPKKMSIKPAIVTTVNLVPCPVCNVDIAERNINTHLDACLKRSEMTQESSPKQAQKRKHLPKLVISILSDRELKKIMKDHGLSITGSRSALNDRYQRFVVLYNSECDNEHPRSVEDILRQIQKEEMDKKNYTSISSMLKIDRKTEPKIIEQTQQQYLQQHKKSFDELIKSIRNREKSKQLPMKRNKIISDDEEDAGETVSSLQESKAKRNCFKNYIEDDDDATDMSNISVNENNLNEVSCVENMDESSVDLDCENNSTEPVSPVFCRNMAINPRNEVEKETNDDVRHNNITPDMFSSSPNNGSDAGSYSSLGILSQRIPGETPVSEVEEEVKANDVDPSDIEFEESLKILMSHHEDSDFEPCAEVSEDFKIKKQPTRRKRKGRNNQRPSVDQVETSEKRTLRKRVKV